MRCPDCSHNQKYRDGMRCGKCGYQFICRKKSDGISDHTLRHLIGRLSDNGQQAFTMTQLTLELCRYWRRKTARNLIGGLIFYAIITALIAFVAGHWTIPVILLIILSLLTVWSAQRQKTTLPLPRARKLIDRYHQAHRITALADGRAFLQPTTADNPQDLQYAPERILLVERDDLVDMLVRNRFHATHKTAVVSRSGYPKSVFEACQTFLRRYPATPVQLLHDASLQGFNLKAQLAADPQWSLAGPSLVDLGLSQEAIKNAARLPWLPANNRHKGVLSTEYAKMLSAGHRVPIDCMGPKPLLNLLGAALIGGLLLLPTPSASGDIAAEFGVEDDFG